MVCRTRLHAQISRANTDLCLSALGVRSTRAAFRTRISRARAFIENKPRAPHATVFSISISRMGRVRIAHGPSLGNESVSNQSWVLVCNGQGLELNNQFAFGVI
jgi:hypothetical protein